MLFHFHGLKTALWKIRTPYFSSRWLRFASSSSTNEELMNCTKLKFIYDSDAHMKLRRLIFNVEALKDIAVKASGSSKCDDIKVLAEGRYNRVFSLSMDNGCKEIIAKMPFPTVGPQTLLTKSEVATMDFIRLRFKAPVPKVIAWDASTRNEVGQEYIIMEKAPGELVSFMEGYMDGREHFVSELTKLTADMAAIPFSQCGSIYYKEDVEPSLQARPLYAEGMPEDEISKRFKIGPSVRRQFYENGRANLKIDRGPWKDTNSYVRAQAQCEISWINKYGLARRNSKQYQGSSIDPRQHTSLLDKWTTTVLPAVLPLPNALSKFIDSKDQTLLDLRKPTLLHADLSSDNVFVTDDVKMSLSGIIDFQAVDVRPLFEARMPDLLKWQPPVLKKDFELLSIPPQRVLSGPGLDTVYKAHTHNYLTHLHQIHPGFYAATRIEYLRNLSLHSRHGSCSTWTLGLSPLHVTIRKLIDAYKSGVIPPNPKYPSLKLTFKSSENFKMDLEYAMVDYIYTAQSTLNKLLANDGRTPIEGWAGVRPEDYEYIMLATKRRYEHLLTQLASANYTLNEFKNIMWRYQDGFYANLPEITTCRPSDE